MKISALIISLLFLSSFLYEVQGIRFVKSSKLEGHDDQKLQDKSSEVVQRVHKDDVNYKVVVVCKGAHCLSAAGMNRGFVTKTSRTSVPITIFSKTSRTSVPITIFSKKHKQDGKMDYVRVKNSPVSDEVSEIAEMDYSPARRRSPIHN